MAESEQVKEETETYTLEQLRKKTIAYLKLELLRKRIVEYLNHGYPPLKDLAHDAYINKSNNYSLIYGGLVVHLLVLNTDCGLDIDDISNIFYEQVFRKRS